MLRVLYLLNHAGKGGTETYIKNVVNCLAGKNIEPFFVYNEEGLLLDWMKSRNIPCTRIEMTGPFDRKAAGELAEYCIKNNIDVVHTHYLRENYIAIAAKKKAGKIRVVNTYHILTDDDLKTRACNKITYRNLDCQIANCSDGVERLIKNGVPRKIIRLIFNGVDPKEWQRTQSTLREEIGASEDEFIILYAARVVEGKKHSKFIDQGIRLKNMTDRKFRMVFAGDGELLDGLKKRKEKEKLDFITFLGFRTDMVNLYSGADLTACPSENETLNLSLIESMACGTPVIATAAGGMKDVVSEDCGILVDPADYNGFADGILKYMEDDNFRASCAEKGRSAVETRFNMEKLAGEILKAYTGE